MTILGDAPEPIVQQTDLPPVDRLPPGRIEQFLASTRANDIQGDRSQTRDFAHMDMVADILDQMGEAAPRIPWGLTPGQIRSNQMQAITEAVSTARSLQPPGDTLYPDLPATPEEWEAMLDQRQRAEWEANQEVLGAAPDGSWAPALGGVFWSEMSDPMAVAAAVVTGSASTNLSLGRVALTEGLAGAGVAGAQLPGEVDQAARLDLPPPSIAAQLTMGALGGAILGGAFEGAGRALTGREIFSGQVAGRRAQAEEAPEGVSPLETENAIEAAGATLRGEPAEITHRPVAPVVSPHGNPLFDLRGGHSHMVRPEAGDNLQAVLEGPYSQMSRLFGADVPIIDAIARAGTTRERETPGSQHFHGNALDLDISGMNNGQRWNLLNAAIDAGFTGFGIGPGAFHIDVGAARQWSYGDTFAGRPVAEVYQHIAQRRAAVAANGGPTGSAGPRPMEDSLLGLIRDAEAEGSYNTILGSSPIAPPRPITQMTIAEVQQFQGQMVAAGSESSAVGAYQIIGGTMDSLVREMGLAGDEVFDAAMQDRMAMHLLERRGLADYQSGRITADQFADNLAHEWAALPMPSGRSAYAGVGSNRALVGRSAVMGILDGGSYNSQGRSVSGGGGAARSAGGYTTSRTYTGSGQVTSGTQRIDVEYEVVDASTLLPASGAYQPRDRSRAASAEQIAEIAATLEPARLLPSPEADRGAPIVGPDRMIESGNGRVQALQRAAELHPDRFNEYRTAVREAGYTIPADVEVPILVARRTTEFDDAARQRFVREANTSSVARMSATERASSDAVLIDDVAMSRFDPSRAIDAEENGPFVRAALERLPQSERSGLVTAAGRLNREGRERLAQAIFARAFDASDVLERLAEAEPGDLRSLLSALEEAAPAWAALRNDIDAGRIDPEFDIGGHVIEAVRIIAAARDLARTGGQTVNEALQALLADIDLLDGALSPLTQALVRMIYPNGRAISADAVGRFLTRYAAEARKVGGAGGGLLDEGPSVLDILRGMDPDVFGDLQDLGRPRGAGPEQGRPVSTVPLAQLVDDGATPDELVRHPDVQAAVARMTEIEETHTRPGYNSDEWHQGRVYEFEEGPIEGTGAAMARWEADAETLASRETGTISEGVGRDRRAVIVIGPPAAGKSTIANEIALSYRAAILDADEIKKTLPEYQRGVGASAVHEESSLLADALGVTMRERGTNLVIPKVGGGEGSIARQIDQLRAAGYEVSLVNMAVEPDEVFRRMIGRFVATGRIIPPEYLAMVGSSPSNTFRSLKQKGAADGYAEIENSGPIDAIPEVSEIDGINPLEGTRFINDGSGQPRPDAGSGRSGEAVAADGEVTARPTAAAPEAPPALPVAVTAQEYDQLAELDTAALREALGDINDLEVAAPDGGTWTPGQILDELDLDLEAHRVLETCMLGRR